MSLGRKLILSAAASVCAFYVFATWILVLNLGCGPGRFDLLICYLGWILALGLGLIATTSAIYVIGDLARIGSDERTVRARQVSRVARETATVSMLSQAPGLEAIPELQSGEIQRALHQATLRPDEDFSEHLISRLPPSEAGADRGPIESELSDDAREFTRSVLDALSSLSVEARASDLWALVCGDWHDPLASLLDRLQQSLRSEEVDTIAKASPEQLSEQARRVADPLLASTVEQMVRVLEGRVVVVAEDIRDRLLNELRVRTHPLEKAFAEKLRRPDLRQTIEGAPIEGAAEELRSRVVLRVDIARVSPTDKARGAIRDALLNVVDRYVHFLQLQAGRAAASPEVGRAAHDMPIDTVSALEDMRDRFDWSSLQLTPELGGNDRMWLRANSRLVRGLRRPVEQVRQARIGYRRLPQPERVLRWSIPSALVVLTIALLAIIFLIVLFSVLVQ